MESVGNRTIPTKAEWKQHLAGPDTICGALYQLIDDLATLIPTAGTINVSIAGTLAVTGTLTQTGVATFNGNVITNANVTFVLGATEALTLTCTDISAPIVMTNTMATAAKTGCRALFQVNANAALGGWSNAVKGYVAYNASGSTSGLGSAVCGELLLSTGTTIGTYAPLESELVANSAVSTGTKTSFLYMNIAGSNPTGKTTINTNGYLFELGVGVVTTTDGMFEEITVTAAQVFDACLRINVGGANYFIGLCDDKTFA